MTTAPEVIHREFHSLLWMATTLAVVAVTSITVAVARAFPARGGLVVAGIVALFVAYFAHGIHRMNRITLTDDRLTVGRESFERADLDGLFGVQPSVLLDVDEEEQVTSQFPLPPHDDIRVAGGGWGRRAGTRMVLVRETETQDLLAIFSRRPQELDQHLSAWLGHVPPTPPPNLSEGLSGGDGDDLA